MYRWIRWRFVRVFFSLTSYLTLFSMKCLRIWQSCSVFCFQDECRINQYVRTRVQMNSALHCCCCAVCCGVWKAGPGLRIMILLSISLVGIDPRQSRFVISRQCSYFSDYMLQFLEDTWTWMCPFSHQSAPKLRQKFLFSHKSTATGEEALCSSCFFHPELKGCIFLSDIASIFFFHFHISLSPLSDKTTSRVSKVIVALRFKCKSFEKNSEAIKPPW